MPPPAFHYIKHGRAFGPISSADLLRMEDQGLLAQDDLVRVDGVTSWQAAQGVIASVRAGLLRSVAPAAGSSCEPSGANDTVFTLAPPPEAQAKRARPRRRLKKCVHCGTRTSADAGFCHKCGGDLAARACRGCGGASPPHAKFCGRCGDAL